MNRSAVVRATGVLVAALAVVTGASMFAASANAAPRPAGSVRPATTSTPYADQVGIGTAIKIAGPTARAAAATTAPVDTSTETPSGAVVIETESHQAASVSDTSVAVLGTKIAGPTTLASTGPRHVGGEAALATLLIVFGALLVASPRLWDSAQRSAARRH